MSNCSEFCFIREFDSVIPNLLLYVPISILLITIKLAVGVPLVAVFTPYITVRFIIDNTRQFKKIMNYWSSKNRFKGDARVKAELFMRRSSSSSPGRRPTLHF